MLTMNLTSIASMELSVLSKRAQDVQKAAVKVVQAVAIAIAIGDVAEEVDAVRAAAKGATAATLLAAEDEVGANHSTSQ